MKQFSELTKKELSELSDIQFDAYVDVALASKGITKVIKIDVDYPDFAKVGDVIPERDVVVYEVDGYTFQDLETAQRVSDLISTLPQISTDYNYDIGSEFKYVKTSFSQKPGVNITKYYSQPKYEAIKSELKAIKTKKAQQGEIEDQIVDTAIDYAAIDEIKHQMKTVVRSAVEFFSKAESITKDYDKYLTITNDKELALQTLWTIYNVQDEELKQQVLSLISQ